MPDFEAQLNIHPTVEVFKFSQVNESMEIIAQRKTTEQDRIKTLKYSF
jgi:hypothetical protein